MPAFYAEITTGASYPATPQVSLAFVPDRWHIKNDDAVNDVLYSFDGVNDHGRVEASAAPLDKNVGDVVPSKAKKLWLRGSAGVPVALVQATTDV